MRVAVGLVVSMLLAGIPITSAQYDPFQQEAWPGEPIDNHIHLTWATLTMEVGEWADSHPAIIYRTSARESEPSKSP